MFHTNFHKIFHIPVTAQQTTNEMGLAISSGCAMFAFEQNRCLIPGGTPSGAGRPPRRPLWAAAPRAPRPLRSTIL